MSDAAKEVKIKVKDLANIIDLLTTTKTLTQDNINVLKGASLPEWPMHFKHFDAEDMVQDKFTIESAHKDILSRHKELNYNLAEVKSLAASCKPRYTDVDLPINNKQVVTGILAFLNSDKAAK